MNYPISLNQNIAKGISYIVEFNSPLINRVALMVIITKIGHRNFQKNINVNLGIVTIIIT